MLILKHLKTLQHVSIIIQIIFREFVNSLLKSLNLKFKNVKSQMWWCGSIMFGVTKRTNRLRAPSSPPIYFYRSFFPWGGEATRAWWPLRQLAPKLETCRAVPSLRIRFYGVRMDSTLISLHVYHKPVALGHVKYVAFGTCSLCIALESTWECKTSRQF